MTSARSQNVSSLSAIAEKDLELSNSTATRFLGGNARKPWMLTREAPGPPQPSFERAVNRRPSAPHPNPPGPSPKSATTASSGVEQLGLPAVPQVISISKVSDPTPAPISPITPGEISYKEEVPSSDVPNLAVPTGPVARISLLPSPEPSNGSHTSPISVEDVDQEENHGMSQVHSIPPEQATSFGLGRVQTANRAALLSPVTEGVPTEQQHETGVQQAFVHGDTPLIQQLSAENDSRQCASIATAGTQASRPVSSVLTSSFWDLAQERLQSFLSKPREGLSDAIGWPRVRLLEDACGQRDLFYLALHQIYCLQSVAPSEFAELAEFGIQPEEGWDVIKQLLVDNSGLSEDLLKWCAGYPFSMQSMRQKQAYRVALQRVVQFLNLVSQRWDRFERELRQRSYPPLIDELVVEFTLTSPVLQFIVFTALCRRHYGVQNDMLLSAYQMIFEKNRQNYQRRFTDSFLPISGEQMRKENQDLILRYRAIYQQKTAVNPLPSPTVISKAEQYGQGNSSSTPLNPVHTTTSMNLQTPPVLTPNPHVQSNHVSNIPSNLQNQIISFLGTHTVLPASIQEHPAHSLPGPPAQTSPTLPTTLTGYTSPISSLPGPFPGIFPNSAVYTTPRPQYPVPQVLSLPHMSTSHGATGVPASTQGLGPITLATTSSVMRPVSNYQGRLRGRGVAASNMPTSGTVPNLQIFTPRNYTQARISSSTNIMTLASQPGTQVPPSRPQQPAHFLLPRAGEVPTNSQHPDPSRAALHQAHLRSPPRMLVQQGANSPQEAQLVQHMQSFALHPTLLSLQKSTFRWHLSLSRDECQRFPRIVQPNGNDTPIQIFSDGSQTYRLRCIRVQQSSEPISESAWCLSESVWPSVVYLHVNGVEILVRRKFHFGKDIPAHITAHLREGKNEVSLNILRNAAEKKDVIYAVAIEILAVSALDSVRKAVSTLPASKSRQQIQQSLSSNAGDDELIVVDDYITIDLVDPFTARICDTPARGVSCPHRECFDLDTFLRTRQLKPGNGRSEAAWKCPICGNDARPKSLLIDGFLAEIRVELQRIGKLEDTKAIQVKRDGSWTPKIEKEARPGSSTRTGGPVVPGKRVRSAYEADLPKDPEDRSIRPLHIPEVIELD